MATEKVTPMVLKVDLQCPCCYKKIKKTLCKFPQIRDQVYDEKANEVMITVVCCSPERIRDKLCYKGGKAIQSIKIVEKHKEPGKKPDKPKEPEKPKAADKPKEPEKPKPADKPKEPEKPKSADKPKQAAEKPKEKPAEPEKSKGGGKGAGGPPPAEKPKEGPKPQPAAPISPAALQVMGSGPSIVHGVPSIFPYVGANHDAYGAGPYYHGYGFPPPPPQPLYEAGYYGHGLDHGYGYGYGHRGGVGHGHVQRRDNYFSEENPQTCSIM